MFTVAHSAKTQPLTLRPLTIFACLRDVLPTVLGAVAGLLLLFGSLPATFADPPTLYNFSGPDGHLPQSSLVQGRDGNFYGTTAGGTVFKMTPAGVLTTLISFTNPSSYGPITPLVLGKDGSFYGTTNQGGSGDDYGGTIFKVITDGTPAGTTLTTLVNFNGYNGDTPDAPLIQARDGNFYGTTQEGGKYRHGTIFKMTPTGVLTTLVNLNGSSGFYASGGLIQARDGNFYGTMFENDIFDDGAVYKLTTDGTAAGTTLTTLLYFDGSNGLDPYAPLVQGNDGSFYGTTVHGGSSGLGSVYKLTTDGTAAGTALTTLLQFNRFNEGFPYAPLIQGNDGSFYGTTSGDGYSDRYDGTMYKLTTDGTAAGTTLRTLVQFNGTNGSNPYAPLVQGRDGKFYGTTTNGGSSGDGTVFKLSASSFAIESLTFLPATVTGGSSTTGVVTLNHLAVGPTVVTLTSSNPAVLSVRSSVTVTLNHRRAVFTATTHPVTTPTDVTLTATSYGVSKTSIVHVTP